MVPLSVQLTGDSFSNEKKKNVDLEKDFECFEFDNNLAFLKEVVVSLCDPARYKFVYYSKSSALQK